MKSVWDRVTAPATGSISSKSQETTFPFPPELDIIVLRDGYMKFKNDIEKITGLNIKNYCSIASLGYDSLVKKGCLEDCYKLSGIPREFIQKFVVGGKCMTNSNKKWLFESKIDSRGKYLNWLEDFDACSLYPSALYRMKGFIKGKPMVIPDKLKDIEGSIEFLIKGLESKASLPDSTFLRALKVLNLNNLLYVTELCWPSLNTNLIITESN